MAYDENKIVLHVRTPVVLEEQEPIKDAATDFSPKSSYMKCDEFTRKFPYLKSKASSSDKKFSQSVKRSTDKVSYFNKSKNQSPSSIRLKKKIAPSPMHDPDSDFYITFLPRKESRMRPQPISEISLEAPTLDNTSFTSVKFKDTKIWKAQRSSSHKRIRSIEPKRESTTVLRKRNFTPLKISCNNSYTVHIKIPERQVTPVHLDYITNIMKNHNFSFKANICSK
ncbi:unnamed protein product [Blepharisma stoltei]|uniref:Uncharacterized protein n=1 Tax=Blepharisma stoltei TaxID=1481888 RepID=A0AAU9IID2_9CILI|nr:unnamed protein product [Blepharisma stoltei]